MADEKETLTTPPEPAQERGSDWLFTGAEIRSLHQAGGAFGGAGAASAEQEPDQLETLFQSEMPFDLPELGADPSPITAQEQERILQIKKRATGMLVLPRDQEPEEDESLQEKHIVFALAGMRYAVPMANIVEIAELSFLTPVPNVPEWIVGVTNLRGDILSVIDFRAFLGLAREEMTDSQRMLVSQTRDGEITTGFLIDRVAGMEGIDKDRLLDLDAEMENRLSPYIRGAHERNQQSFSVIDLEALLRSLEEIN